MPAHKSFKIISLQSSVKYTRLLQKGEETHKLKSGLVRLEPGESVGEHSTENKEEIILFLKGKALVTVEGHKPKKVFAPSAVYIPPQTKHNIENAGSVPVKYVFTVTHL